jgi:hypothetical protein
MLPVCGAVGAAFLPPQAMTSSPEPTDNAASFKSFAITSEPSPQAPSPQWFDRSHMATYGHRFVARKKISTTVYITPEQDARLKALHGKTKVPVAEYIRQGIDLVLEKYRDQLPGQVDLHLGSR